MAAAAQLCSCPPVPMTTWHAEVFTDGVLSAEGSPFYRPPPLAIQSENSQVEGCQAGRAKRDRGIVGGGPASVKFYWLLIGAPLKFVARGALSALIAASSAPYTAAGRTLLQRRSRSGAVRCKRGYDPSRERVVPMRAAETSDYDFRLQLVRPWPAILPCHATA